jgi:hypothetical protein
VNALSIPTASRAETVGRLQLKPDPRALMLHLAALTPCNPNVCQVCALRHGPRDPHGEQSLFYHLRFELVHGRPATHADATAHCPIEIRHAVQAELQLMGRWTQPACGCEGISEPPYYEGGRR